MTVKNVVGKTWAITPSADGKRWSAWPAGDKPLTTILAQQAALLSPGQCIKFATDITKAQTEPENEDILQWAINFAYDRVNRKVHYIGKIAGPARFHWLSLDEATNHWTLDAHDPWTTTNQSGHGYAHNTCDDSGNFYHVPYGSRIVQKWNGTAWSALPAWTQNTDATGSLKWLPWGGGTLFYNDGVYGLIKFNGTSWDDVYVLLNGSYHDFSVYNDTADVLIFGGGNGSGYYKCTSALSVSAINAPSTGTGLSGFTAISANAGAQGIVCSDPNSAKLIAYYIETGLWAEYNITTNTWTQLTQSSGSGASPQTGLPNFTVDASNAIICGDLPDYGCTMWIARPGTGENLNVWLYRHS